MLQPSDLVGCRYRRVQAKRFPDLPHTHLSEARAVRADAARATVLAKLPVKPDSRATRFRRIDLGPLGPLPQDEQFDRYLATLEALAAGYTHITGGVLEAGNLTANVDILLREGDAYTPINVSNHRVERKSPKHRAFAVPTYRLGLSQPLEVGYRVKQRASDSVRLAVAARALRQLGLDSGRGGYIGQDRDRAFLIPTDNLEQSLTAALAVPVPDGPRRTKECASCRFWDKCEPELIAADDLSLFLPGERGLKYREQGIHTVQGLIDAGLGEPSQLAAAWRAGVPLLRRPQPAEVPRADVEVDVDMEAYLDQGAYLWGAWHQGEYHPFVTWEPLGGRAEAANFEAFWSWLMGVRADALAQGKTFKAYCYSAHGENHWMTMSAKRFGTPSLAEVEAFIASDEWVDLFVYVKQAFAGPFGLSLKTVAPVAGFHWDVDDFDGEESVAARRVALAGDMSARERLLTYNADDVQATAVVRDWMSAGASGVPLLGE